MRKNLRRNVVIAFAIILGLALGETFLQEMISSGIMGAP